MKTSIKAKEIIDGNNNVIKNAARIKLKADLAVLKSNPLTNINALREIKAIYKVGIEV